MVTKRLKFLLSLLWANSKKRKTEGFTLIELLVALIIASLIISSLLGLVIDILHADRDENAFNETQREMQMALNYISRELREAVYVYDANCMLTGQGTPPSGTTAASEDYCPRLTNFLPRFTDMTPILAFWKPEEIEDGEMPTNTINPATGARTCTGIVSTPTSQQECQDLLVKRRTYTLVVYLQSTSNPGNRWSGKTRIVRYALPKYSNSKTLQTSTGYVDPYDIEQRRTFQSWPIDLNTGNSLQAAIPLNQTDVLVDFVDTPTANLGQDNIPFLSCPPNASSVTGAPPDYIRTPPAQGTPPSTNNSFYTCVRRTVSIPIAGSAAAAAANDLTNVNQDVLLYLRGNAFGKSGIRAERNFRPILQTQVLVRGVIDKNPEQ